MEPRLNPAQTDPAAARIGPRRPVSPPADTVTRASRGPPKIPLKLDVSTCHAPTPEPPRVYPEARFFESWSVTRLHLLSVVGGLELQLESTLVPNPKRGEPVRLESCR